MAYTLFAEKNRVAWLGVRPGVYGAQIFVSFAANNATVVGYTVPAGKTLLLTRSRLSVFSSAALVGSGIIQVYNTVPALLGNLHLMTLMIAGQSLSENSDRYFPLELETGWTVKIVSSAASAYAEGTIEGILVNPLEQV